MVLAPVRGLLPPTAWIDMSLLIGDRDNAASIYLPTFDARRRGERVGNKRQVGVTLGVTPKIELDPSP